MMRTARIVAVAWLLSLTAKAQTYVAPADNGVVVLASSMPMNGSAATSSVYASSGIEGFQVDIVLSANSSTCSYLPATIVSGSPTATGTFLRTSDALTIYIAPSTNLRYFSVYVTNLPAYFSVNYSSSATTGGGTAACTGDFYLTPVSFSRRTAVTGPYQRGTSLAVSSVSQIQPVVIGGYNPTLATINVANVDGSGNVHVTSNSADHPLANSPSSPFSVATGAATLLVTTSTTNTGFNLQNVGTVPACCGTTSSTSCSIFGTVLAPDSVGGSTPNGDGGAWTETGLTSPTTIYCAVASGTGKVAVSTK